MRYILTGHRGLIGEYLKRRLDKENECVMNIDARTGFNILDLDSLWLNPDTQHTDILIHTAAHCKINQGIEHPELPHLNNADGTHKVLEFVRKNDIKKFIFFSSSRVLSPEENPYTASKKYGELLTKAYAQCYGLDARVIRPSTVYGPCHDITSRLMTDWCQAALKDEELPIYGDKNKTLDFTYVDDFVDGVMLILNNWEKTDMDYNISGAREVNLKYLADLIIKEAGGGYVNFYEPEVAQPQRVRVNTFKMRMLGYNPKVSIEEGVKRMINYYRENE